MLGYDFRHLMKFCQKQDLIGGQSYVAQYVSLSLLTVGPIRLWNGLFLGWVFQQAK